MSRDSNYSGISKYSKNLIGNNAKYIQSMLNSRYIHLPSIISIPCMNLQTFASSSIFNEERRKDSPYKLSQRGFYLISCIRSQNIYKYYIPFLRKSEFNYSRTSHVVEKYHITEYSGESISVCYLAET